jgi:hypothetical protein
MEGATHPLDSLEYINRQAPAVAFGRTDGHGKNQLVGLVVLVHHVMNMYVGVTV